MEDGSLMIWRNHLFHIKSCPDFSALGKDNLSFGAVMDFLNDFYQKEYLEKLGRLNEKKPELERQIAIQVLDACWKRHLQNVDSLRSNIGLRAYAQRNPINEFKENPLKCLTL
ncbi:MAG: hypothetical protein CM15mP12_4900 [Gammaproteobacteria bacterium]|nr:MAG: hypothetical protein CM15mP12_4900 [Gammaproteobacteria bacterium]